MVYGGNGMKRKYRDNPTKPMFPEMWAVRIICEDCGNHMSASTGTADELYDLHIRNGCNARGN